MRRIGAVIVILMALALIVSVFQTVSADQKIEKEITLNYKGKFKKSIKPPVKFPHEKHAVEYKIACTECHHIYKDGKNVWKEGDKVQPCFTCHPADRAEAKELSKKEGVRILDLKNAFHKNCKDCHKKADKEGKKAPTKCNECHVS
jgi:hypothetical protein